MAQSPTCIVLVVAMLINTLSYCRAENVYCVTPTASSCSSWPHNSTHCATLSEYAQEAELCFTSNTTMVFLPGNYALDVNITVANVAGLTMCGESFQGNGESIDCNVSVDFSFTSMVELKIYSLAFKSCSRNYSTPPVRNYALLLQSTQYTEPSNCSFHDNIGTALVVNNLTLSDNIEFTHNHCESDSCVGSGIINLSVATLHSLETQPSLLAIMAVVQSMHHTVVLLPSVEPTTSSTTQLAIVLVVQSMQHTVVNLHIKQCCAQLHWN